MTNVNKIRISWLVKALETTGAGHPRASESWPFKTGYYDSKSTLLAAELAHAIAMLEEITAALDAAEMFIDEAGMMDTYTDSKGY